MKKVALVLFLSGFVLSLSGCNSNKSSEPDPAEKKWYVFKRKSDKLCVVHHGKIITGANGYDLICGPLTKKEAEKCEAEKCEY